MNYIFLDRIENVKNYVVQSDKIAFLLKNGSLFYNNENFGKAVEGFFFQDIFLFYSVDGVSTTIINTNTDEKKNIPKVFNADTVQTNTFLMGNNYERVGNTLFYSAEISLYQLNPYNLIKILPNRYIFSQFLRIGDLLFTEKLKTTLSSLSLLTGEYEWEVDLGAYGEIIKILGLEAGFLWVLMLEREEHLKKTTILGINPANGQIVHRLKSDVVDVHLISFAEDKKSIIAINYINRASWLMELNLPDLSVKRDVLIQSVHEADIYIRQYVIQDGLMYFTAVQKGGFWPQYLGVLDIARLELLWHKKVIDIEAGFNGPPQVSQGKLYALDTAGNLYVFEKEKDTKPTLAK